MKKPLDSFSRYIPGSLVSPHSRNGTRWKFWDFAVGLAGFWLAFNLSPYHAERPPGAYYLLLVGGLYGLLLMTIGRFCGVPQPEQRMSNYEIVATCALAVVLSYLVFATVVGLYLVRFYGRYIVMVTTGVSFFGMVLPRLVLARMMAERPLNVVIYGAGETARACLGHLAGSPFFVVVGFLDDRPEEGRTELAGRPILGSCADVDSEELKALDVDLVVVCLETRLSRQEATKVLHLRMAEIEVLTMAAFIDRYFKKVPLDYYPQWAVSASTVEGDPSVLVAKRVFDFFAGLAALILSLPLWPLIALAIRRDSPGPVFFRQQRVGWREKPFTMLKFRSMAADAEEGTGPQWAVKDDPRVTRVGRILRMTRLDELPQFWNVVRGDMSLVGPRPERPELVEELEAEIPFYEQRHMVPPGLTGWAQIRYRYGASKADAVHKLEYDLYYVRHMSVSLDVEILLRTIPLLMKGSR